jgi:hypothetical protein
MSDSPAGDHAIGEHKPIRFRVFSASLCTASLNSQLAKLAAKIDQAVELFSQLPSAVSEKVAMGHHFEVLTDFTGEMYSPVNKFVVKNIAEFTEQ